VRQRTEGSNPSANVLENDDDSAFLKIVVHGVLFLCLYFFSILLQSIKNMFRIFTYHILEGIIILILLEYKSQIFVIKGEPYENK